MKKKCFKVMLVVMALMLCASQAFAHNAVVNVQEGTVLEFGYGGDAVMSGARIFVYDEDGEEIATGQTNSKGLFDYGDYVGEATEVVANDGEGHLATYEVPADAQADNAETGVSATSQMLGVVIVVAILAAVAVVLKRKK